MKVTAIIQARMGSKRLPGKVLKKAYKDLTLIEVLLKRLSQSKLIDNIVIATSASKNNEPLIDLVKGLNYDIFIGSEDNVLERYYQAAKQDAADIVVRITGDCPLVDSSLVDDVISKIISSKLDYVSNNYPPTYPDGLDVEAFKFESLEIANNLADKPHQKEHVTPYFRESGKFKILNITNQDDLSDERWTVDEVDDFELISTILNEFNSTYFPWTDVLDLKRNKPEIFLINSNIRRNEGLNLGTGQKLYKRAKKIIPGGNMLLSKRPEMFLPEKWPSYFSKAKGCKVWDLDGKEFIDMSIMGIGTNILGYAHDKIDREVQKAVVGSNMSTFNCPEEVYLAEKLIDMHPWADMAKFTRSGGEANAVAIRIARAASGKDKVAVCGYHGWHDWYLAANLQGDSKLEEHLLPGLNPAGVPSSLKDTIFPFHYNNFEELEDIVNKNDIGVIKMEVVRNDEPENNFLHKVRELANNKNIVLIFDECTSGFRETFGGIHKKYNVNPDMAMFGKALGNGYAINAIIGKKDVMESAQSTFISSTFWTERIGPTAALKSLEVMEDIESWQQITNVGNGIKDRWNDLSKDYGIKIKHFGIPALAGFSFDSKDNLSYKTLITQEMLKEGMLAANSIYVSIAHEQEHVDRYFYQLEKIFSLIKDCEDGRNVDDLLESPVVHSGFARLN